ncbi:hypothetical protein O5466_07600 [Escherichia coli]|nr:hypothetical protein [Escherichia coli]
MVNNTSGQVVANGLLGWNSQALNNQSGLIQGKGISINTAGQTLDNRGGTLNSLQELTVSTGAMDNRGGTVGAKTTADLSTTSLDNREGGRLVSEGELRLPYGRPAEQPRTDTVCGRHSVRQCTGRCGQRLWSDSQWFCHYAERPAVYQSPHAEYQ